MRVRAPIRRGGRRVARKVARRARAAKVAALAAPGAAKGVAKGAGRVVRRRFFSVGKGKEEEDHELLYPTFASRDHDDPARWRVRVHGWIYRPRDVGVNRVAAVVALLRFYNIQPETHEHHVFLRRIGSFVVRNRRGRSVMVQCCSPDQSDDDESVAVGEEEDDDLEGSECGVVRLSTTVSDNFGHFRCENWVHECELPLDVVQALGSSSPPLNPPPDPNRGSGEGPGRLLTAKEGEDLPLPTEAGDVEELGEGSGGGGGGPIAVRLRVIKKWNNPFAPDESAAADLEHLGEDGKENDACDREAFGRHADDDDDEAAEECATRGTSELEDEGVEEVGTGTIYFIPPVGWSVISDIDDTIKITGVVGAPREEMIRNTFMREFVPANGMPRLFQDWARQGAAFHYVSSSPWQLQPELSWFFKRAGLPGGSFHLKDFDVRNRRLLDYFLTPSIKSKPIAIESLLEAFPSRRFVLVGDSGEKDPEIYAAIAHAYPQQVAHILIRRVPGDGRDPGTLEKVFEGVRPSWQVFEDADTDLGHAVRHLPSLAPLYPSDNDVSAGEATAETSGTTTAPPFLHGPPL